MVKVAAAQIRVVEDVNENLLKILDYIDKAKAENADIVCFCEISLNFIDENSPDVSKHIEKIQEKCKEKSIWCIFGSYVPEKDKVRNVIFLVDRQGKIVYEYDKVHLWVSEKESVIAGKTNKVIDTEFGKIGIVNCWDTSFPSFMQELAKEGARIIFCPVYEVDYEEDQEVFRRLPLVRAFENLAFIVWCDAFTDETLSESYICHPLKFLKEIKNKEGMILAELNLDEVEPLRKYYDHLD